MNYRLFGANPSFRPPRPASQPTITPSATPLKEGQASASRKKLSECRVLIVDDVSENAELQQIRLRKHVKSAETAETSSAAILMISEAAKSGKYDFVLCDMRLDGNTTALDVEKEVQKSSPSTVFIVTSGVGREELPEGTIYLQKPFGKEKLLELLSNYFSTQPE